MHRIGEEGRACYAPRDLSRPITGSNGVGVEAVARSGGMGPYYEKCLAIAVFIHDMRAARVPNYPSQPLASGYEQMRKSARVRVHMTQPQKRF